MLESTYDFNTQTWTLPGGRKPMPGLVVYARVDGGFSVWDPARNYWRQKETEREETLDRPSAYHFSFDELMDGTRPNGRESAPEFLCNGLIRDWENWRNRKAPEFNMLCEVLERVSPSSREVIRPVGSTRVSLDDSRDIPTLGGAYGDIPVLFASAGVKRIMGLAYLLVWAWSENKHASELRNQPSTNRFVLLFDEVEAHLHPQWQRTLLPALLDVLETFGREGTIESSELASEIQVIAVTHSPLVMASVETMFCDNIDRVFNFQAIPADQKGALDVQPVQIPWAKQGDTVGWLVSEAFGLKQARSRQAEDAIEAAEAFMRGDLQNLPAKLGCRERIHEELKRVLPGHDPFWPRWIVKTDM